ncbi:MAG: Na/Pi cotransporter family protein [candidate division WOR-3 bacterium]|nr:Na/Pi cotransporter family protein [candidate division WOR-3 bacterium]
MKRMLLLIILIAVSVCISGLTIDYEWKHITGRVNAVAPRPFVIQIDTEGDSLENYYAVFSTVEGKGRVLTEKVYPDSAGIIKANVQTSSKMENNIYMAQIFKDNKLIKVCNFSVFGLNWLEIIFGIVGGLGLFLFGLKYMSDGLQKVAGDRMRNIIAKLTKNTFFAVIMGLTVTSMIQSSSATTVMVVGLVNAGLMNLAQSIGVIMGANIGTTITAQLIAFRLGDYALPAIALGVAMLLFAKKTKYRFWGEVLFGFGLLFLGMNMMSATVHPLRQAPQITEFFIRFSDNPILAMLTGVIMTVIVQSSSATVGLTIVLASQGLIDIYGAIPLVLGENIGTTITAGFAALSSNVNGKRVALVHALFNVLGVTYMLIAFYTFKIRGVPAYLRLVDLITPGNNLEGENISRYIANSHSIFNIFNTLLFIPFAGVLKSIVEKIIPDRGKERIEEIKALYLDDNLLSTPAIAVQQVKREMEHMLDTAMESIELATETILNNKSENIDRVKFLESKTDYLQNVITRYLIEISKEELFENEAGSLPVYIHSINDIERVGDHAINLIEFYQEKTDSGLEFSEEAAGEILIMKNDLMRMIEIVRSNLENPEKEELERCFIIEENINRNEKLFAKQHAVRMTEKICDINANAVFNDILATYEKAGDHILNIAQAIYNKFEWSEL